MTGYTLSAFERIAKYWHKKHLKITVSFRLQRPLQWGKEQCYYSATWWQTYLTWHLEKTFWILICNLEQNKISQIAWHLKERTPSILPGKRFDVVAYGICSLISPYESDKRIFLLRNPCILPWSCWMYLQTGSPFEMQHVEDLGYEGTPSSALPREQQYWDLRYWNVNIMQN